jgi:DNA polymerase-3 subunit epsilon
MAYVEDGQIKQTKSWLIRPPTPYFDPFNVSIHGITAEDVKDSPTFDQLWIEVGPMLNGNVVVAHNASFDMSVLRHVLDVYRIPYPELDYYCTCNLCRAAFPGHIAYRLDFMADVLGITFQHHDAEQDAAACAMIALECCRHEGLSSLAALAEHLAVSKGKLNPNGYSPCSLRRARQGYSSGKKYPAKEPSTGEGNNGPLFVVTGTLQSMTRHEAAQKIADHGGRFKDTVTRETDFLVVGEQDFKRFRDGEKSNKLLHAESLLVSGSSIEIISEDDFLRMVGS